MAVSEWTEDECRKLIENDKDQDVLWKSDHADYGDRKKQADRKSVYNYTSRVLAVGSQKSNMFDSCDRSDDGFANSEFDRLHMTIGLQNFVGHAKGCFVN